MTETTIKNYQKRAARTIARLKSNAVDGAHMALGITTEVQEMSEAIKKNDFVNIREEHGDTNWYVANECNIYGLDFNFLYETAREYLDNNNWIAFKLHDIVDLHKKELAYGKEMDTDDLYMELLSLVQYLIEIAENFSFSYEESLQININKLYKRYPDKFTQDKALNRDLDAEHETLK